MRAPAIDKRNTGTCARRSERECGSEGRRAAVDRHRLVGPGARGRARDLYDRAAARSPHRSISCRRVLLVGMRAGRAAAGSVRGAIILAPVPGRGRDRRYDDHGKQEQHDTTHGFPIIRVWGPRATCNACSEDCKGSRPRPLPGSGPRDSTTVRSRPLRSRSSPRCGRAASSDRTSEPIPGSR